ncbi:MAG: hypothetical protein Q4G49_16200 [Paracoccus sp. (in: a-proteobacteria)]|nr:hypothetical protein [Paracoccus sp. (in: a-proteobacteria)]
MNAAPAPQPSAPPPPRTMRDRRGATSHRHTRLARALLIVGLALSLTGCAPQPASRMVALIPIAQSGLDSPARQSLHDRAFAYDLSLMRGDLTALQDYDPPRMARDLARENSQTMDLMQRAGRAAFADGSSGLMIVGRLFVDRSRIGIANDGSPFALIPTRTLIAFGRVGGTGAATEVRGLMLAFPDGGQWYFLRLNNAQTERALTRAYPQFRGVPLPRPAGDRG